MPEIKDRAKFLNKMTVYVCLISSEIVLAAYVLL
jgi:hypothetical protein